MPQSRVSLIMSHAVRAEVGGTIMQRIEHPEVNAPRPALGGQSLANRLRHDRTGMWLDLTEAEQAEVRHLPMPENGDVVTAIFWRMIDGTRFV